MRQLLERMYRRLDEPLALAHRPVLVALSLLLALTFTAPLWNITMKAPQYPRGLTVDIYAYKLVGGNGGQDLVEINTINHYIGMRPIQRDTLPDLDWMPFAIGLLVLLGLRVAAVGDLRSLIDLAVLSGYVSLFGLARFVYMLHAFGHELDPTAAMRVEPFMPAIFGMKQIANFTTWAYPRWGSLCLGGFVVGVSLLAAHGLWRAARSPAQATPVRADGGA